MLNIIPLTKDPRIIAPLLEQQLVCPDVCPDAYELLILILVVTSVSALLKTEIKIPDFKRPSSYESLLEVFILAQEDITSTSVISDWSLYKISKIAQCYPIVQE